MAAEIVASGNCGAQGDNLTWTFDSDGVLKISGSGEMADYEKINPFYPTYGGQSNSPWNEYRQRVKTIELPDGLTSIGDYAFYYFYSNLYSIEIPDNVTKIGTHAFDHCEKLTGSLVIPGSVEEIGNYAFYSCAFSGTLVLEDGIESIGYYAFCGNEFVGDLNIPDSVITIGELAFCNSGFTGLLKLSNNMEIIEDRTFDGCGFTENVVIPSEIIEVGKEAFRSGSFTNIYFLGDAPTVYSADSDDRSFISRAVLHFVEGKDGWITPVWNGYNTLTWNPEPWIENYIPSVKSNEYRVIVEDSKGNPVEGAKIYCMEKESATNKNGIVTINCLGDEDFDFVITKEGYQLHTGTRNEVGVNEKGYGLVRLYKMEESPLYLKEALYLNGLVKNNILTGVKRLNLANTYSVIDDGMFDLQCKSVNEELVEKYELFQGNKWIAESENGIFSDIKISDFQEKGSVKIRAYDADAKYADTNINLLFVMPESINKNEAVFGRKGLEFSVADNVPFIGGGNFEFEMPGIPLYGMFLEDSYRIGINLEIEKYVEDEDFNTLEKAMKKLDKMAKNGWNTNVTEEDKELIESILATDGKMDFFSHKGEIKVVGYLEAKIDDNEDTKATGNVYLVASYELGLESPIIWVSVVPVTLMMDLEVEGSFGGESTLNCSTWEFENTEIAAELKTKIEAAAVAGLKKLLSVGVYGQAELPIKMFVISSKVDPWTIDNVDLTGELGIKVYVLFGEYKKEFAYNTWHLYTRPDMVTMSIDDDEDWNRDVLETEYYNWNNYAIADTSYLSNESSWLGDNELILMDLEQTNIQELQTSTYRNMQPQIISVGDNLVMVWTGADTSREAYNLTQLKYSVYDGIGWSEPQAVDSNDTADYLHDVYSDGDDLWVVYQESATAFDEEPTLEEVAEDIQIVAAKFDAAEGEFTDHTVLSNEGGYNTIPALTIADGKPYAVWASNSDITDLFGQNDTNEIHYAEFDSEWSAAQVLVDGLGPVTDLSVGDMDGKVTVAYVSSEDSSLETDDDNVLYTAVFGEEVEEVSDGIISALKFAELPDASGSSLVWYDNGKLKTLQDGDVETVIENGTAFAAGFDVLSDRIIFNHATDGASDVFASIYEDGEYQEPVRMTYQDRYIQSYSFVEHDSKAYAALVQTDVTITEDAVEDDCTLSFLAFEGVTDVSLESVAYDDADLVAGTDLPIEVILKNNGDTLIEEVDITILDEDDEVCASVTETVDLAAYEEVILTVDLPIGNTIRKQIYTVSVTADNDANADNNSWQILVGDEMLSVSGEMIRSGSNVKAIVKVLNDGHETTGGTLTISSVSDGTVLIEKELTELAAGESHLMILDGEYLLNGKDSDVLQLEVQTTAGNNYSADRIQQMYIGRAIVTEEAEENKITISEVDGNVIGIEISNAETVDLAAAVYDANGKMLAYDISTDIASSIYNYETFIMDLDEISNDQKVKVFMLKAGTEEPLCEAAEL